MTEHLKSLTDENGDTLYEVTARNPEADDSGNDKVLNKDVSEALDLVEHNKFGVSFELICTQLFEYDVKISAVIYQKIKKSDNL